MGAWVFHALAARLEEETAAAIEVLPVELPGHNSRLNEPLATDLVQLTEQAATAIAAAASAAPPVPFAILGHSMGAWLAFEVVQALDRLGAPRPCHLIALANRAPSLCGAEHDLDPTRLSQLDGDSFWAAFTRRYGPNPSLEHPAIRARMLPILCADFCMVETYTWDAATSPALAISITAIGGERDTRYTREQVAAWRCHTTAAFQQVWLHGAGHSCLTPPPQQLVDAIRSALLTSPTA